VSSSAPVCVDDACRLSHCVVCDAHPGACSHTGAGARYLHPIVYEPVAAGGWRVPEHERARWDNPPPVDRTPVDEETLAHDAILDLLDPWHPTAQLRMRLAEAYRVDPVRVSRLTTAIMDAPGVRNPCGLLYVRLVELDLGET